MNPIIVKRIINQPIGKVWNAITDLDQMVQWFFENIPDFKAEVGFVTEFKVKSKTRDFLHLWKIVEVIPNQKIKYDWRYPDYYGGSSFVTFELISEGNNKTELIITAKGIENFPQEIPEFSRESCRGGWEYFSNRLKNFLEND
ncbi:uncharacterized protein YndB with AHSA1/START domain [Tenacibaculum adriaticum]|uniref:Uncharacterized protein YndB with AHSA1/START domain n=1 Tax=Tenacibaculum adriaticum TaxID=413713 RepID=A0A5S5DX20_9FLAO|nr:SRPBCC domain-containing protein [Tenacibaculum adriaticum]TYQ00488.1 uncharacterized protein YndB with AHSA1/START domain [Tenacibaculum adriaticum]